MHGRVPELVIKTRTINSLAASLKIFKRLALLALVMLLVLSLSRIFLMQVFAERVEATAGATFILLQGIRFDLVLFGMVFGPILIFLPWMHYSQALRRLARFLVPAYVGTSMALVFFIEAASRSFIDQFDTRPNYLFVEYLKYPKEVLATLTGTHLVELLVFTAVALTLFLLVWRWLRRDPSANLQTSLRFCLVVTPLIMLMVFGVIRSTLDHRPLNPSNAAFSEDSMVNQLPLNSPYAVIYAIYERQRRSGDVRYGHMPDEEVIQFVLKQIGFAKAKPLDTSQPTLHRQKPTYPREKPLNLVIVLEESLGAEYVGSLGGINLTPELDKLAEDGIWLERLYATGIRSARGIEAVITGFTPTARQSIIKLPETQDRFFTIARLLQNHGYQTSFLYGGESHFDNMRRFFLSNGIQKIVDENDFEDPLYYGAWGVSDEDLFNRAHQRFSQAGDQPFFSLVFTSSNHEPYDIPEGRVEPETGEFGPRNTAIKYADHALGQFMEKARNSSYWENTVFLIVADHSDYPWGGRLVPVDRFRIPGLFMGGSIEPRKIPGITSQIDLVPTMLSLIGVDSVHPAIGRDLTTERFFQGSGRAMMQFHQLQAYIERERIIIHQPDLPPSVYVMYEDGYLGDAGSWPRGLISNALAYASFGPLMIRTSGYQNQPK